MSDCYAYLKYIHGKGHIHTRDTHNSDVSPEEDVSLLLERFFGLHTVTETRVTYGRGKDDLRWYGISNKSRQGACNCNPAQILIIIFGQTKHIYPSHIPGPPWLLRTCDVVQTSNCSDRASVQREPL